MGYHTKYDSYYVWPVRSTLSSASAPTPKTGQTSSYYYWDDGGLQSGVAWPVPRFADNGDGSVTDDLTGLVWLKNPACFPAQNWDNALVSANTLTDGICGLTDGWPAGGWRLPNRDELLSLVDYGRSNPALPTGHPFTSVQSGSYWSATTSVLYADSAWVVSMGNDFVSSSSGKVGNYNVWPVRSGQYWTFGSLVLYAATTDYGTIEAGTIGAPVQIRLQNKGASPVTITATTLTGTDSTQFTVAPSGSNACSSLTPVLVAGTNCTLAVSAAPTSSGAKIASLTITTAGGSTDIPLSAFALPDATAPTITAFTIPTSSPLTVPVTTFTATDNVAVTGYLLTETATTPAASTSNWSVTIPTSYTFSNIPDGVATPKPLYAWAKDAAGNISNSATASTTITLPDVTKPIVTAFTIPATGTSLTVPISTLTATDNAAVTGYLLTETVTAPVATDAGWGATKPTSYTFTGISEGIATPKTLYAWAKDAAGNVSLSLSAITTITLSDATKPTVTGFTIPATGTSLTIAVSTLTATDNVAVSSYCITEINSSTSCSWSTTAPTSYTFTTAGTKTLYAWAKDGAGNISTSLSASVDVDITGPTITLSTLADGAITNNATMNISGTVSDNGGVASLTVNGSTVTITNGGFSYVYTLITGTNTIITVATDTLGNNTTDTRTIILDTTAPALTISAPADNSKTAQPLATITGTISETSTVTVTLNNGTPQNASITGNSYSAVITLVSGLNNITIKATDLAGNTSSAVRTVTYDNTNPSLAITYPSQDVTINQNSITINGTVSDTLTTASVSIIFNNQTYTPTVTSGTFSQKFTIPSVGTFTITATATDEAGNSSSVTRNVIYASKPGDCDNSGTVTIAEVQSSINMFLGLKSVEACVDQDGVGGVSIAEVQKVINSFLGLLPANAVPVANAGAAQSVLTGAVVTLDGSASSDVDGDALTYSWAITSKPAGSSMSLSSATAVKPTLTADVAGAYVLTLVVNDGKVNSSFASVTITAAVPNVMPVANAGNAQSVTTGTVVTLDGSASSDENGDTISYSWSFTSKPVGSSAALSSSTVIKPTFTADLAGTYILSLVVNDGKIDSSASTVTINAAKPNTAPIANAGNAQSVATGRVVTIDGSGSSDADGNTLTYLWAISSKPAGSSASLSSATAVKPTFTPDVAGSYILNLVVNDGKVDSAKATVTITAANPTLQLSEKSSSYFDPVFTNVSMPYSMTSTSQMSATGIPAPTTVTISTFKLTATGGNFTVTNLSATDSTGRVVPYFSNLSNGQTISAGTPLTFSLISPLTKNYTVNLTYTFTIAETGKSFTYAVNLKTN